MDSKEVRAEAALQALIDLQAMLSARPYLVMVELGLITTDQAAAAIRASADLVEQAPLAEPFVGYAIGQALRDCADALVQSHPPLHVIEGGRTD